MKDDAGRIKTDEQKKYNKNPHNNELRSGSALRGEVLKIQFETVPDSCPATETTTQTTKGYIIFIDSASNTREIERIPFEDVEFMAQKMNIPINKYSNINYFENYNNPLLPQAMREVPVDTMFIDTCTTPCPCSQFSLGVPSLSLSLKCPERELKTFFWELKGGLAIYNDINEKGETVGKDDWLVDAAAGVRFGASKRWALGLMFSSGVKAFDSFDSTSYKRVSLSLYGRYDLFRKTERVKKTEFEIDTMKSMEEMIKYDTTKSFVRDENGCYIDTLIITGTIRPIELVKYQERMKEMFEEFEVRPCINPFVYGLFGASIDRFSMDLFSLNFADDCKTKVEGGGLDISLPLNYGFGIGLDIPISANYDLSADMGFRSFAFGDRVISGGNIVPVNRRINTFVIRLGINY